MSNAYQLSNVRNKNSCFMFRSGYSYLTQYLPMVCRLQHEFKIYALTLGSKVKV